MEKKEKRRKNKVKKGKLTGAKETVNIMKEKERVKEIPQRKKQVRKEKERK